MELVLPSPIDCTPEMEEKLKEYVNDNCTYTLSQIKDILAFEFQLNVSISPVSWHLLNKLYTINLVSFCTATCSSYCTVH